MYIIIQNIFHYKITFEKGRKIKKKKKKGFVTTVKRGRKIMLQNCAAAAGFCYNHN